MDQALPVGPAGSVVTVGSFDGFHLGHRVVLEENLRRARAAGRTSLLVTFDPHPLAVVNPAAAPPRLTMAEERAEVLAATGLDVLVCLRFDRALAALSPERFVDDVLLGRCGMRELVIGYDHGLGRGRSGDVETLRRIAARRGFALTVVDAVDAAGQPVSSTRLRQALAHGDLGTAAVLLGRPYSVSGQVVEGARRGRALGVPTINLGGIPPEKLLPPDGVYAGIVECRAGRFGAMVNQGGRPTFGEAARSIEAHLFGFEGDLYGQWVRLEWVERLRETRRFASVAELRAQLEQDRRRAEQVLRHLPDNHERVMNA